MRATLEQLKALSNSELLHLWAGGNFPFDGAKGCGSCLTTHRGIVNQTACKLAEHEGLKAMAIERFGPYANLGDADFFTSNIEEFYAMRIFYDSFYRPSAEPAPAAAEQQVAETVEVQK